MAETQSLQEDTPGSEGLMLPPMLTEMLRGRLPYYSGLPKLIGARWTQLELTLDNFRTEATRRTVSTLKKFTDIARRSGQDQDTGLIRIRRDSQWTQEYFQDMLIVDDKIEFSEINSGYGSSVTPTFDEHVKGMIHNHPGPEAFSANDLGQILLGVNAEKYMSEEFSSKDPYPPVKLEIVSVDDGYFLAFPTRETNGLINNGGLKEDALDVGDGRLSRYITEEYPLIWQNLLNKYGQEKLYSFTGQILSTRSLLPEGVNSRGGELLVLQKALDMCRKYKIGLYFSPKDNIVFKRINRLEDHFPELSK